MSMKIKNSNNSGYSFIELLVVITLMSILGTITTEAFILGIKAQGKGEIMKDVKQNADYAGQVIDSMVRNSVYIDESLCNINNTSLTITNRDGYQTTFECTGDVLASVSGEILQPTIQPLIGSRVKVESNSCVFSVICPTPPLSPKYVFVNFTLSQSGTSALPAEKQSSLEYQNTISLRNYE